MKKYLVLLGLASGLLLYSQINTGAGGGGGGSGDALVANPLSQFAATTSLQLKNTISDETGSGLLVFATSPSFTTPVLGTPTSVTLTNGTGLPESGVTNLTSDLALKAPLASPTFTGTVTLPSGQALIAPALGTPASGVATNLTGLPLTTGVTGVLPVANGGTGSATGTFRQFTLFASNASTCTFTDLGASFAECGNQISRGNIDFSGFIDVRVLTNLGVTATTGDIRLDCSDDTTFGTPTTLFQIDNPVANTLIVGAWATIPSGCKTAGGVYVRVGMLNGNTTEDPGLRHIQIQVR